MEESEVDEPENCCVELHEDGHQPHVHLGRLDKPEAVGDHPGDGLPLDLGLEVVALDAAEHLPQRLGLDDKVHELGGESPAEGGHLHGGLLGLGEGGVEEAETETVLQVPDGVNESRISLTNDVIKAVFGLVLSQSFHCLKILFLSCLLQFTQEDFELSKFPDHGLVQQKSNILLIVQSLYFTDVSFLGSFSISRLSWEDSFQNAKSAKVLKLKVSLTSKKYIGFKNCRSPSKRICYIGNRTSAKETSIFFLAFTTKVLYNEQIWEKSRMINNHRFGKTHTKLAIPISTLTYLQSKLQLLKSPFPGHEI